MAREQDSADRRIEWLILVLGLAGVVAIWLLFAWGESPIEAWLLMSSQAAYTFTSRELGPISAMWLAGLLAFFLAIAGCLAILVVCVKEGVTEQGSYFTGSPVAVFFALGIVLGVLVLWRRVSKRQKETSAECLLMCAYIGGVATWAAAFAYYLEPTAVVAGITCVVYAVSLWRRTRA
jgi:hypothetical protein